MRDETSFRSGHVALPNLGGRRDRALGLELGHGDPNTARRVEPTNVFVDEIDLEEKSAFDGRRLNDDGHDDAFARTYGAGEARAAAFGLEHRLVEI
jgi:hypothetical protein